MMHSKHFGLTLAVGALLISGLTTAQAQRPGMPTPPGGPGMMQGHHWGGPGGPGGHGKMMMQRMAQTLNLTPAQQKKLMPIMQAQQKAMMSAFQNTSMTMPQKFQKMQAMRQTTNAKIGAILTPAQRTKWVAMQAQMRQRMGMHRG
jgi:protein CpxP